jgi:hypothetical protein
MLLVHYTRIIPTFDQPSFLWFGKERTLYRVQNKNGLLIRVRDLPLNDKLYQVWLKIKQIVWNFSKFNSILTDSLTITLPLTNTVFYINDDTVKSWWSNHWDMVATTNWRSFEKLLYFNRKLLFYLFYIQFLRSILRLIKIYHL